MKKKIISIALIVSLIAIAAMGTLAYFTDETAPKVNTFTLGKVDIDLTEPSWNADADHIIMPGVVFEKDPTITVADDSMPCWVFLHIDLNKYVSFIDLIGIDAYANNIADVNPNHGDYPGFVAFVNYLIGHKAARNEILGRWIQGIDHEIWQTMNFAELQALIGTSPAPKHIQIILGHKEIMNASEEVRFMESFTMPETVTQAMIDESNFDTTQADWNITFKGYAIQANPVDTLADAYAQLFPAP